MTVVIQLLVLLPLLGFVVTLLIPRSQEKLIAHNTVLFIILHFAAMAVLFFFWAQNGFEVIHLKEITVFKSVGYEFYIDFYFDKTSFVYLFLGAFICFLISQYSRYYMHREEGYKRFFSTFLFFYSGLTLVVSAGNLETLFIGWEILGISSFLLIAFYRDRYLPVKNAVKVFSIYRIGDVGIILAMWLSHHLWHENISFIKLNNYEIVHEHLVQHSWIGVGISLLLLLSAMAKSAIFPFSSWLPRAMEGPTPSSAVFYGSLSVHIGAFLLLRTYHFWEHQTSMRVIVILFGLLTAVLATFSARVQSNIKSQIAYSSLAQIGLIFIEIALGLEILALVHIAGNAFLRTYQLLISPSTVTYKIREQFFHFQPREKTMEDSWPKRFEYTLYILSLKEWNLDNLQYKYLWNPVKQIGSKFSFLSKPVFIGLAVLIFLSGLVLHFFEDRIPLHVLRNIPLIFAVIGLVFVLKSFTERKNVFLGWWLVVFNHCWIALAVSYNEHFGITHHIWYLGGVVVAGLFGFWVLRQLKKRVRKLSLDQFYGYSYEHPRYGMAFLIAGLVLAGFPISPTFIGEDLVFSHIHANQFLLAFCISLSFIIDGLALVRIYSRVFLGPFIKTYDGIVKRNA